MRREASGWPEHRRVAAAAASAIALSYDADAVRARLAKAIAFVIVAGLIVTLLIGSLGLLLNDRI